MFNLTPEQINFILLLPHDLNISIEINIKGVRIVFDWLDFEYKNILIRVPKMFSTSLSHQEFGSKINVILNKGLLYG